MRGRFLVLALLPALLLSACGDIPGTGGSPAASVSGSAAFDATLAMKHLQVLAGEIGPRVAGSPGESDGVAYLAEQLRASGYAVEVSPFSFDGDPFRPATVATGATRRDATTMTGSAGGRVAGAGAFANGGDMPDVAGRSFAGNIVVVDRGDLTFREKYENVRSAGAIGMVVVNNEQGIISGTLNSTGDIPVVVVSQPDGEVIRQAALAGKEIVIDAPAPDSSHSTNVLARPSPDARCDVLVGGHHDTVPGSPGAHDNASGAASVVELARSLAADGIHPGICFATFGAEESGLHGSDVMAAAMKKAGELPRYYLNLDMVGEGALVSLIGDVALQRDAASLAAGLGLPARSETLSILFGSDHQSFQKVGVPALMLSTDVLGKFHTPLDAPAEIQLDSLARCGTLARAFALQLLAQVARGSGPS